MKHIQFILLYASLLISLWLAFFWNRGFLLHEPDLAHLDDYFSHSQWAIPLSTRKISDDQLYLVAALKLSQGASPFTINPEVPPLGKYFYALGLIIFGNPYWISFLLFLAIVTLTGILTLQLTNNKKDAWLASFIISISPAVTAQISLTMLELPIILFLLLHINAILKWERSTSFQKQVTWLLVAGSSLGGFAASKFPLFVPVILLADCWLLWKKKQLWAIVIIGISAIFVFLGSYWAYFWQGHSLIEWLHSFFWTIQFYVRSNNQHAFFQIIPAIFIGRYWIDGWTIVQEWTILWPLITLVFFLNFKKVWQSPIKITHAFIVLICTLYLIVCLLSDFRARYFFPLLPIFIAYGLSTNTFALLQKTPIFKKVIFPLILSILIGNSIFFYRSGPENTLSEFTRNWQANHYQDAYSFLSPTTVTFSRSDFHQSLSEQLNQNTQLQNQEFLFIIPHVWPWQDQITGEVQLTQTFSIGVLRRTLPLTLHRIENRWFIVWDDNFVFPNYQPNCQLTLEQAKIPGKLLSKDLQLLSSYQSVDKVRLLVTDLPKDTSTFQTVASLLSISPADAENLLQNTANGRQWLDLNLINTPLFHKDFPLLTNYLYVWPSFTRRNAPHLTFEQQRILTKLESQYPQLSDYSGGKIQLICQNFSSTENFPSLRQDVILNQTWKEIFGSQEFQ